MVLGAHASVSYESVYPRIGSCTPNFGEKQFFPPRLGLPADCEETFQVVSSVVREWNHFAKKHICTCPWKEPLQTPAVYVRFQKGRKEQAHEGNRMWQTFSSFSVANSKMFPSLLKPEKSDYGKALPNKLHQKLDDRYSSRLSATT